MQNYKIGYTTGVFDLFHIGHLNILKCAKERCDFLIVGVSTDECAFRYKNKKPVISFYERMAIVESIKFVDKVVPQENMNKLDAWDKLRFNVIFHGDDWKGSSLYRKYEEEFLRLGVAIVYLPYTVGISSTEVVKRITG